MEFLFIELKLSFQRFHEVLQFSLLSSHAYLFSANSMAKSKADTIMVHYALHHESIGDYVFLYFEKGFL